MLRTLSLCARLWRSLPAPLLLTGVFAPQIADAAPSELGEDEIQLASGALLRGTLVTEIPGESVSILVTGEEEPRSFAWSEVGEVRRGKYAAVAAPEPEPEPEPEPRPAPEPQPEIERPSASGGAGPIRLDVSNPDNREVVLYRVVGEGVGSAPGGTVHAVFFEDTCVAPCGERVPEGEYFIGGRGVAASRRFRLDANSPSRIEVRTGRPVVKITGALLLGLGGMTLGSGVMLLALGAADKKDKEAAGEDASSGERLMRIGGIMTGAGAAGAGIGIPVMLRGRTKLVVGAGRLRF